MSLSSFFPAVWSRSIVRRAAMLGATGLAATLVLSPLPTTLHAGLPDENTLSDEQLGIQPASDEPQLSLSGFTYPEGVQARVVAAEPDIANAVAFGFDGQMNLYVCETFRQQAGVEDNRGHTNWLEDDLSNITVQDRAEMFEKYIKDDAAEYKTRPDRIRLLTDRDADGRYTDSTVYATFDDLLDGTGAGVLAVDRPDGSPDIYFTCIPDLYRLRDADGDGAADEVDSLASGFGVRVAFRGHDMHGLIRGIDGKLYWSIGDRGYYVLTKEGATLANPATGAVFRSNLDGTELEVFATGLRNPQELAFNDTGDLFSVDNNSDSGDMARLVSIEEGSDAGWRMYYQYLDDRGPWNREAMWLPDGQLTEAADWVAGYDASKDTLTGGVDPSQVQPAYVLPPVVNITDGPSGFVCYPGTGWGGSMDNRFFISDFRGTASKSGVRSFSVEPHGAHYTMTDDDQFIWQVLVTDVDFGYDGSIYVLDWVDGWNGIGKARLYEFSDPQHAAEADDVEGLFATGFGNIETADLAGLLTHKDRRVRLNAQWELADRGAAKPLVEVALSDEVPARYHGIWGLGQMYEAAVAAGETLDLDRDVLGELLGSDDNEVVRQTLRAISWSDNTQLARVTLSGSESPIDWAQFVNAEPRVQAAAALAFGRLAADQELTVPLANQFVAMLAENDDADPALRHAITYGLSQIGRNLPDDGSRERVLLTAIADGSDAVQRGGAVVLRHWGSPEISKLLEGSPAVAIEAARAIYDLPISEAMPQLATVPIDETTPEPLARRVVGANFAVADADAAERLVDIAANAALPKLIRLEAIAQLAAWDSPPRLDRTIGQFRQVEPKSIDVARKPLSEKIDVLLADETVRTQALPLVGQFGIAEAGPLLAKLTQDASLKPAARVAALRSLEKVASSDAANLLAELINDSNETVRSTARDVLATVDPAAALPILSEALESFGLREQQAALATLSRLTKSDVDTLLETWMQRMQSGEVPVGIQLDLLEAADKRDNPALRKLAAAYGEENPDDLSGSYRMCLEGGSARAGKTVFNGFSAAACRRCHVVGGTGAAVGPNLSQIGKEKSRQYLLEAIVEPNKHIAKGYATKILLLEDGRILSGVVAEETDDQIVLVTPTGERLTVDPYEVEAEKEGLSGMPADLYKQLSRRDIRDLVEYLASLTEAPKGPAKDGGHE